LVPYQWVVVSIRILCKYLFQAEIGLSRSLLYGVTVTATNPVPGQELIVLEKKVAILYHDPY
jgi:hypothetical protein